MKKTFKIIVLVILAILWNILIFNLSSESGTTSAGTSEKVIKWVVRIFRTNINNNELNNIVYLFQPIIRKAAHFMLYFIAGLIYINLTRTCITNRKISSKIAICLGTLSAIFDEIHQLYVPGRSGEIKDIFIDLLGILCGVTLFKSFNKLIVRRKNFMDENKNRKIKKVLFAATVDIHIISFHIPYLKMFKERGYEVHVVTNGNAEIPYCDVKHVISIERNPFKIGNIKAIKELRAIIDKEKFDIIHCHTPMGSVVTRLASKKARKNGTRVIYTAHGFHFYKGAPIINWLVYYPIEKWLSKYTDILVTINEEDYNFASKKFKTKQIELVHGVGIDMAKFDIKLSDEESIKLKAELGILKNDFCIACVGELNNNKNQIMQIEAMKEICKENNNIKLLLVGEGDNRNFLEGKIKEYNLENNVKLLGYRKDVPRILKVVDLVLSTSLREGLPVNIIESITARVPVVSTNCRGSHDIINNGKNGILVDIGDVNGLVKAILKFKNEEYKVEFEFDKFGKENIEKRMIEIYNFEKKE